LTYLNFASFNAPYGPKNMLIIVFLAITCQPLTLDD